MEWIVPVRRFSRYSLSQRRNVIIILVILIFAIRSIKSRSIYRTLMINLLRGPFIVAERVLHTALIIKSDNSACLFQILNLQHGVSLTTKTK